MLSPKERRYIEQIGQRAACLYLKFGIPIRPQYISDEIEFCHTKVCALRLREMLQGADGDFAHDIGGIHQHLNMPLEKLEQCFLPRFAKL